MSTNYCIYGIHPVTMVVYSNPENVSELYVHNSTHNVRLRDLIQLASEKSINVHRIANNQLTEKAHTSKHQGVVAFCHNNVEWCEQDVYDILINQGANALLLILDCVTDPHNLGACLRTAEATGVQALVTPKDRSVGLTASVRKVASGAAELIPLVRVANLARTMRNLKQHGMWMIGTTHDAHTSVFDTDLTQPLALVVGSEDAGLRRLTREHCDQLVSVPMAGVLDSLNVSVATGVCLYEVLRQRRTTC